MRIYPAETREFAAFVELVATMTSGLIRCQETPSDDERGQALHLLAAIGGLAERQRRGFVVTSNPEELQVGVAQGAEESVLSFLGYLKSEVAWFVSFMSTKRGLA